MEPGRAGWAPQGTRGTSSSLCRILTVSSVLSHSVRADASPVPSTSSTYHALIGGVVAVIVFLLLSLLIVLGHYLIRHKGTGSRGAGLRPQ